MGFAEDIWETISDNAIGSFTGTNITIVTVIGFLFIPAFLVWGVLSMVMLYIMFFRNFVLILPKDWRFRVIISKPYGDGTVGLWLDRGALCRQHGLSRFKVDKEKALMQRMDTYDIFQDGPITSVNVVSLGPSKKFFGRRKIVFENRKMIIGVENPDIAQVAYLDHMGSNQPDYLAQYAPLMAQLFTYWTISAVLLLFSTVVVIYPLFLAAIGSPFGVR